MAAALRRQTFCGKSQLEHHVKTERASLPKLHDHQCYSTYRTQRRRRDRRRPTSSASSSASSASVCRQRQTSEDHRTRALVPPPEPNPQRESADASFTSASAPTCDPRDGLVDSTRAGECQICFDPLDVRAAHVCATCCTAFCASCTRWYIALKVQEGAVSATKMVCPAPQCARPLSHELIAASVSSPTFAKYTAFVANQQVGVRFCPRAGCAAVIAEPLHTSTRRVQCDTCGFESCMRCGGAFHALATCRRVEKRFRRWQKRHNVRACPRCRAVIEKQGGCAHMQCVQCEYEFCWACRRSWRAHDEALCLPLRFLRSESPKFGCCAPLRVVTKTAIVAVAAVAAVAGAGLAAVVLPPVVGYQYAKDAFRRHKYARASYVRAIEREAEVAIHWRGPMEDYGRRGS
ncbi:unnamed protein product [Hyaloperonospora brassicae]|uniref:RBR-type E3 ubiquitin transferase n=1 Tax=Hyaloperonospora brassicae TaxID=162125 RepID=A0AAV0UWT4_HYABA|nr:unnamed protein product [Hyaloperonospora brassicae]